MSELLGEVNRSIRDLAAEVDPACLVGLGAECSPSAAARARAAEEDERELRAVRNQALFRLVNERMDEVGARLGELAAGRVIACECADLGCIEMIAIAREEYESVRANRRQFVVVSGHLHIPGTKVRDGVRYEEVSLGYPQQWRWNRSGGPFLRQILPTPR